MVIIASSPLTIKMAFCRAGIKPPAEISIVWLLTGRTEIESALAATWQAKGEIEMYHATKSFKIINGTMNF